MVMDRPFTTASPVITSYDYLDVEDGLGYVNYYGFVTEDSGGKDYIISRNVTFTAELRHTGTMDIDTSTFNVTKIIRGSAIIQMSYGGTNMAGSDNVIPTVRIYKYDGSTETPISATVTGPTKSGVNPGVSVDRSATLIIPLTTSTISAGDILRIKVTSSGNNTLQTWMSPNNLGTPLSDALHTKFVASIPFELNL